MWVCADVFVECAAPTKSLSVFECRPLGLILDQDVNISMIRVDLCGSEYYVKLRVAPCAAPKSTVVMGVVLIVLVWVVRIR